MTIKSNTEPSIPDRRLLNSPSNESMAEAARRNDVLLQKLSENKSGSVTESIGTDGRSTRGNDRNIMRTSTLSSGRSVASWETGSGGIPGTEDNEPVLTYLKSRRLNRLIHLKRSRQAGQVISLADIGRADGYPICVFLGLGCVRYLVALFDEIADSLKLRLICIDRWGLGKSSAVPTEKRGVLAWADVVDEVMDQLKVDKFGILAHSAGAPYALATAYRLESRVCGHVHLLAPWVNADIDGGEIGAIPSRLVSLCLECGY